MKTWKIWLGLVVVFGCGVAIGGIGAAVTIRHVIKAHIDQGPMGARKLMMKGLKHHLRLSAAQTPAIEAAVAKAHDKLWRMRDEKEPEIQAILEQAIAEMGEVLDQTQRERLANFHAQAKSRWHVAAPAPAAAP